MARFLNNVIKRFATANEAPSPPSRSSGSAGVGFGPSFKRDPKATQVKRVGYQLPSANATGGGGGRANFESPDIDFAQIDAAIERDSYVMQTVLKYSELVFKSGWQFKSKNQQALDYVKLRLDMIAVGTDTPTEMLFQGIADDIVRYANAFIVKARGKGNQGLPPGLSAIPMPPAKGPVIGYFRLPPSTMQVGRDLNGNITGYQQTVQGQDPITFRPEDVIHIKVNVPAGKAFGEPWLAPVIEDVRLLRKVEENAALLLYRHIFPLLAYTVGLDKPGYEATDEELNEIRSTIENMPTDGAIVLPERHKIDAVNLTAIDGKPYLDYFEARVFSGLGMSQVDMGRGDTANRNTADAMTGIKADRINGWQRQIALQINKYIIEELLVEGGFDPLADPNNKVEFVFNEIEAEMRIKLDTHEIYKYEHNVQTFEETRINLKLEPQVDESRLYLNMVKIPEIEAAAQAKATVASTPGTPETNNKQQPTNQHGTRSGPKRSTESLRESAPDFISTSTLDRLQKRLASTYEQMEADVVDEVRKHMSGRSFPIKDPKTLLSAVHFAKDTMWHDIEYAARQCLMDGVVAAKDDLNRGSLANVNYSSSLRLIGEDANRSLGRLEQAIQKTLSAKLADAKDLSEAILKTRAVFQSLRYRVEFLALYTLAKAFNYGYALSFLQYEEDQLVVEKGSDGCVTCQEKSGTSIHVGNHSSLDEVAIYHHIPPWHPHCNCRLTPAKEPEAKA
ncbi:hypothetical protein [Alicyclobacillus shizuokensis]|uniref:hypothetical protein n=1 Tax=Alicyclobacillus shizuokensis TaxID=392014 RepID=UPI000831D913|nr:hypothetical protein [Alicyclobacillus shizuokensis]